jgi:twitching motility protein PilI
MDTVFDLETPLATDELALPSAALAIDFRTDLADAAAPAVRGGVELRQGLRCGELRLMVRFDEGSELTEVPPVRRLPNAPAWLAGVANIHGTLVPVFDLAAWLGVGAGHGGTPMLLVLGQGADAAGVLVDGLPQRLRFTPDDHADRDTAPAALVPHLRNAAVIAGELWFDLDCDKLLQSLERSLAG